MVQYLGSRFDMVCVHSPQFKHHGRSPENCAENCLAMAMLRLVYCMLALLLGNQTWLTAAQPRMVFAHYRIYFPDSIPTGDPPWRYW